MLFYYKFVQLLNRYILELYPGMTWQTKAKDVFYGFTFSLIFACIATYLFLVFVPPDIKRVLNIMPSQGLYGQVLTYMTVSLIISFAYFLCINREFMARGVMLSTVAMSGGMMMLPMHYNFPFLYYV